jgi:hypothetical protein
LEWIRPVEILVALYERSASGNAGGVWLAPDTQLGSIFDPRP